jgi:serine O-acetyltransferase
MTRHELLYLWSADLYRYTGTRPTPAAMLRQFLLNPGFKYTFLMRLCVYLESAKPALLMRPLYFLARILYGHYQHKFGIYVPHRTQIGPGLFIGHPGCIHVNVRSVIGANCNLSQGVTLGEANRGKNKGFPTIGDNVYIGPGAKIVGAVQVADEVAIGANCVVTHDAPPCAVVVGIPGRVLSYDGVEGYIMNTDYDRFLKPGDAKP